MKRFGCSLICAAAALSLLGISSAHADRHGDGLSLVCGGFGGGEHSRMLDEQSDHALTLIFATAEGAYVGGVTTRVEGPDGQRVEKRCGPIGQISVNRAGQYRITAEHGGETVRHSAQLEPRGGSRAVLRVPDQ